ncbi:TIGR00341 family protein [Haloprofundus halophilus]|uniref:TIGR00341 family protein n=1 Tax=Haloprofundus halophilus TaxID=2283527 RepID=UPI0018E4FAC8|nr:TIGR00341 family protein [Haloprofundus halophilus]
MRLVQVMVPAGKREAILNLLDDEGIDYALSDETSGREYIAIVSIPLPTNAVEPVLEKLRETGIERDAYTVVLDAETVISRRFDGLREKYAEEEDNGDRIAREELVASAEQLAPEMPVFVTMTVISAVVATAGLLLNDAAVIVGSMVIAPLVGPAMATSVGSVVDDRDLFLRGAKQQIAGGALAIVSAAVFALILRLTGIAPFGVQEVFQVQQVRLRLAPDVLSLAVALAAGVAGALSISSGVSAALVGVMIAAALVPPIAVVGIGIAWGSPATVLGSFVLVLVNFISINFTALGVLWYMGYRPVDLFQRPSAEDATFRRILVLGVAILVLSSFLGGVTYASFRTSSFEETARTSVDAVLSEHEDLTRLNLEVQYDDEIPFRQPRQVTVTVGHPVGMDPPPVADAIVERIRANTNAPFGIASSERTTVVVRYVEIDRSTDRTGSVSQSEGAAARSAVPSRTRAAVCKTALCA